MFYVKSMFQKSLSLWEWWFFNNEPILKLTL